MAKQNSASCLKCEKNFENIKRVGNYCNNCYNENRREKYTTNIVDARKKANQRAIILRQKNREKINEQNTNNITKIYFYYTIITVLFDIYILCLDFRVCAMHCIVSLYIEIKN